MSYGVNLDEAFRRARRVCRQDSQRNQTCRHSRRAADEVRVGHQSKSRQANRSDYSAECAGAGGSGDQMRVGSNHWSGISKSFFGVALCALLFALCLSAEAEQFERMRHIGALMNLNANDPESKIYIAAFLEGLRKAGWMPAAMCRSNTAGRREILT